MPIAKNPFLRYRILNSCFRNKQKRYWAIQELIDKLCEHDLIVDKRTLERDFESMRHDERLGYKAPIGYDKKEKAFYYTNPNFTIDSVPLTNEDLQVLTVATNIIQQYKGIKLVEQFEGMVDKLSKMVNHATKPDRQKVFAFEESPYYKGHDYFDVVLHAINNKQPLVVTYRKFAGEKDDAHVLHPYFMKEYRGRWYVLGHSEARHYTVTLALDRIIKIKEAHVTFRENKVMKPKEYFQHVLGITLGKGPVEEIELWFSPALAPYLKTQHLHHTQKTVRDDHAGLVITLKLIPNPELLQLLLGYCGDVKVLKPLSFKEKYEQAIRKGLAIQEALGRD
jgi:predicted DNA-binding transcriptional regulator YafY